MSYLHSKFLKYGIPSLSTKDNLLCNYCELDSMTYKKKVFFAYDSFRNSIFDLNSLSPNLNFPKKETNFNVNLNILSASLSSISKTS